MELDEVIIGLMELDSLFKFVDFTHKFQQVKRMLLATGEDRNEDDADHSFQLAMVAWYLNDSKGLGYDLFKLVKYGLVHDLVEVYAGDTYFHTTDQKLKDSKTERERKALNKIKKNFQEFPELYQTIHDYEQRYDDEAKFIYALDKILPVINIYMDNGKSWHRDKVTYEMVMTKDEKIITSKDVEKIWRALIKQLEKNKHHFHS